MISGTLGHTNFKLCMLFETIEGGQTLKYEGLFPNYCQIRGTKKGVTTLLMIYECEKIT